MNTPMEQVVIPNDYFLNMSKKDYTDYKTALIREFFQNSYDAGAKNFRIHLDKSESTATFIDDGCGMDIDTIRTKLLVLGMSHKTTDNAVGAFGHAKLLLYFSWQKWEIRTQDIVVTGTANYFSITHSDTYVNGTISKITIGEDLLNNIQYYAKCYFNMCNTNCKVMFSSDTNPEPVELSQNLKCGDKILEGESVNIFKGSLNGYYIVVRQNGVYMFQQYMYNKDGSEPMPIFEIKKSPVEMLMQNRDYFKKPYDTVMDDLKAQLTSDSIESFRTNQEGQKKISSYEIPEDHIITKIANKTVITHEMTEDAAKKLFGKKQTIRLLQVCEDYYKYMKCIYGLPDNVTFGPTEAGHAKGLAKSNGDGTYQIFINLGAHTADIPNYRKVAVMLLNTLKHEVAHVMTVEKHKTLAHDENFVRAHDILHDKFWDTIPFIKIFKETWASFK